MTPSGWVMPFCASRPLVGDEPFAVILADDLVHHSARTCLQQMLEVYMEKNASVVAVENVAREQVSRYGIVETIIAADGMKKMKSIVEKPSPDKAPSTLAVVGRYIFTPAIMAVTGNHAQGGGKRDPVNRCDCGAAGARRRLPV